MSTIILDGNETAARILEELYPKIENAKPGLGIILVGSNPASMKYVQKKVEACERIGMHCELQEFPESVTEGELLEVIHAFNKSKKISGFIVQLPLPPHLDGSVPTLLDAINPSKDADGFTPASLGKLLAGLSGGPTPATPSGILALLDAHDIAIAGQHVVVVGRSAIVGRPLSIMLLQRNATVTVCHSHTHDLAHHTKQADILVCAAGKPGLITKDMVKPGATVIDVGTTDVGGSLKGDVDFESVQKVASAISPVPGGVGPLTVAMLLKNCVAAAAKR